MPQTREHFQILNLLEASTLVVALTKSDVADDETLDLADLDVQGLLEGTRYESGPVIRVSSQTGAGIEDLKAALSKAILSLGERALSSAWFLPIALRSART